MRAAGKPPESSAQTNHKIPTRATKSVRGLTRVPSAHSGCVLLHLRVSVVDTLLLLCVHVVLCVIKGCEQRRPGGRRVMQSAEVKERTQGRQEGREVGREERKEELLLLGIQLSRNVLTVMSYTGGSGWGGGCILGSCAEVTPPVLVPCRLQTSDKITHLQKKKKKRG